MPPDEVGEDVWAAVNAIRENMLVQMHGHGMGRHTAQEVHQLGSAELLAISDFLGDKPFFFGDRPTGIDATAYAYLAHIIELRWTARPRRSPAGGRTWSIIAVACARASSPRREASTLSR